MDNWIGTNKAQCIHYITVGRCRLKNVDIRYIGFNNSTFAVSNSRGVRLLNFRSNLIKASDLSHPKISILMLLYINKGNSSISLFVYLGRDE